VSEVFDYTKFGHWDEESGSFYCLRDSPPVDLGRVVHQRVVRPPGSPLTPLLHLGDQSPSSSSEQAAAPALQELQEITPLV